MKNSIYIVVSMLLFAAGCAGGPCQKTPSCQEYASLEKDYRELHASYNTLVAELKELKENNFVQEMTYRNKLKATGKTITVGGVDYHYIGNAYGNRDKNGKWHGVLTGEIVWGRNLEHYASMLVFTENSRKIFHYRGLFDQPAKKLIKDAPAP